MFMKYEYGLIIRGLLCFTPISLFYLILTPLTLYGSYLLLWFYNPIIYGTGIIIGENLFELVGACIAAAAYLLLLILILLTKEIGFYNRIKMFLFGSLLIYLLNIIRIAFLVILSISFNTTLFEIIHTIFWKFLSGIYVAGVWILLVYLFKIKSIPIYSDLKYLYKNSLFKK